MHHYTRSNTMVFFAVLALAIMVKTMFVHRSWIIKAVHQAIMDIKQYCQDFSLDGTEYRTFEDPTPRDEDEVLPCTYKPFDVEEYLYSRYSAPE